MPKADEYTNHLGEAERAAMGEIELIDEEGRMQRFEHLLTLSHNDISYLALTSARESGDSDPDEISVGFLRIEPQPDGSDIYKDDVPESVVDELFIKLDELLDEDEDCDTEADEDDT
ncbi:MAG: DUF1292 domain-containing protein [Oscillospiraceae bacterium]|jgi:uncharacterized protein YrzB (UPF0473 family)|nr:DUF1292 domain-containing protein [Oscillospiraceae bacterium]